MFKAFAILSFLIFFSVPAFSAEPPVDISSLKTKAAQGDASAQVTLGNIYERGEGVTEDYIEAEKWYRKAADQGNVWGQLDLAILYKGAIAYDSGLGVKQDDAESAKWYRKAADQGQVNGQYEIGKMYAEGKGVAQSYADAYLWYSLAISSPEYAALCTDVSKERAAIAAKMTPEQIEKEKRLVSEWKPVPAAAAAPPK